MGGIISALRGDDAAAAASERASSADCDSRVSSFHSANRWQLHLNSLKESNQLLVIDFTAAWCGPCKFMKPALQHMSVQFTDVEFAMIDVDELPDVSKEFGVQAMPTFVLMKSGKVVDTVVGAKKDELERKIQKHRAV
uniref:Thioredoxin domain-containing protein n=1 Tax=Kalanchoe fedtschenkoi TaxID=63787 RepID=A0A7N0V165_KALFE